jgi:hypothetical protein
VAGVESRAAAATANNAEWCDLVCRSHGVPTSFGERAWVALRRSPPANPDAITLVPDADIDDVLAPVDRSAGCSVKDSFASIDLSPAGFHILFEAEWIYRDPARPGGDPGLSWSVVRTPEELRAWAAAHGGGDVFTPALVEDSTVAFLVAREGDAIVGGVIGNRSAAVVGVSNLFATTADEDRVWAGAVSALSARFPGLPMVGYEHGPSLAAARRAGFATTGPLRVWMKD